MKRDESNPIQKILYISTGHMRYADAFYLDKKKGEEDMDLMAEAPFVQYMDYGYLFYVLNPEEQDCMLKYPYSSDLLKLLVYGYNKGCKFVHFDADAVQLHDKRFPIFDW